MCEYVKNEKYVCTPYSLHTYLPGREEEGLPDDGLPDDGLGSRLKLLLLPFIPLTLFLASDF